MPARSTPTPPKKAAAAETRTTELVAWAEELHVDVEPGHTAGTVRVRTYITEEQVSAQVPVEYEEAVITRERVDPAAAARMTPPEAASPDEFRVALKAQRAVVRKRLVPVERLTVHVRTVSDTVTVHETCRTEHFDIADFPMKPDLGSQVRRENSPG
ncbi:MAG: YsnF/AvaK domain-containing protein [Mycobacteriaceae bacterium]|nr:YsnF/AvaK domain-containing protein [Mycobacteriaceae bacterium]